MQHFCRPNEGIVQLFVEHSPMAAPGLDVSLRSGEEAASEVQALVDKGIKSIKAVDQEALCIIAGRQV